MAHTRGKAYSSSDSDCPSQVAGRPPFLLIASAYTLAGKGILSVLCGPMWFQHMLNWHVIIRVYSGPI